MEQDIKNLSPTDSKVPIYCMSTGEESLKWKKLASNYKPDWVQPINSYPGVWARVPDSYYDFIRKVMAQMAPFFAVDVNDIKRVSANYAVVTKSQAELGPYQTIPHFDNLNPNQIALVHYLCDSQFGGTGFYKHCETGFEEITVENHEHYRNILDSELEQQSPAKPEYIRSNHPLFHRTQYLEAQFGDIVAFPSNILHSACIAGEPPATEMLTEGRLTITSFIVFGKQSAPV
ncbi:hypothetical protein N473_13285 [Pseudoalteromonas luteoviolacea CPMOR-1]|uniref:Prolyl 4-hydroxylase alpha subunit Fe(2+) 2OG dioxygenase domain-containing protein n=1 Tax=Pseudoalteromonas luteoviolacea CPMOR-1 TaxID=1365248 RepID=A0A167LL02_9GAMM|nr:DUF6445 family protein [Pseudoalteromonas luteoviolacea]KZN64760.1 hypothetical protein N473_13285 [Pseudoalteromonas luteoviolacea CPMOR-1]